MKHGARVRLARVKEELVSGATRKDVIDKLSKEFDVTPRTIETAIAFANKELEKEADSKPVMAYLLREEMERAMKEKAITDAEVDNYLTKIIRREIWEEKVMNTVKGSEVVKVAVSTGDMLRAIALYFVRSKMKLAAEPPIWTQNHFFTVDGIPEEEYSKGKAYLEEYVALNKKHGKWDDEKDGVKI